MIKMNLACVIKSTAQSLTIKSTLSPPWISYNMMSPTIWIMNFFFPASSLYVSGCVFSASCHSQAHNHFHLHKVEVTIHHVLLACLLCIYTEAFMHAYRSRCLHSRHWGRLHRSNWGNRARWVWGWKWNYICWHRDHVTWDRFKCWHRLHWNWWSPRGSDIFVVPRNTFRRDGKVLGWESGRGWQEICKGFWGMGKGKRSCKEGSSQGYHGSCRAVARLYIEQVQAITASTLFNEKEAKKGVSERRLW